MQRIRPALWAVLLASVAAALTPLAAAADEDGPLLGEPSSGAAAVQGLGDQLPTVAARYGRTAGELEERLRADDTLHVDTNGHLLYIDYGLLPDADEHEHHAPDDVGGHEQPDHHDEAGDHDHTASRQATGAPPAASGPTTPGSAPFPLGQTFELDSRPGADRVLYLDFDGHTVTGTAWNADWGVTSGHHPAFSLDGDPSTFNDQERAFIQGVWQRVAEDYAPFDVNVTTKDPGQAAITRSSPADEAFGTRVLISPSQQAAGATCSSQCGGIAYVGVVAWPEPYHAPHQPAWVFPHLLGYDEKNVAEAASHEAGHNLGLDHHGLGGEAYYDGHGAWAPIMGGSYHRPITQWSRGEYPGASNPGQDDIATMIAHEIPLRADDHGTTRQTATSLGSGGAGAILAGTGVISTHADVDYFGFTQSCSGTTAIAVGPAPTAPNLDARLRLLDASGSLLGQDDPPSAMLAADLASGLDASLDQDLGPGTYYLAVDGVGAGTLATGYSDYGSLGAYSVEVRPCTDAGLTNDDLADAQELTGTTGQAAGSNVGATTEPGEPTHAGNPGGASVWYRWTAPADGMVTFSTAGSGFDTLLGVYTGTSVGALTEVAANDDGPGGVTSEVADVPVTEGTLYHVAVDGFNGGAGPATGAITLSWAFEVTATVPGIPINVAATAGPERATVTWTPPHDGNSPLTGYTVTSSPGGHTATVGGAATSAVVTGLTGGSAYTFTVTATNGVGSGAPSASSNAVVPTLVCSSAPFVDVPAAHVFCGDILWLSQQGITGGYNDDTFRPGTDVTRQAAAAFLFRLADEPAGPFPDPGFTDVPATHPFHEEIAWAAHQGITGGYNDDTFRPGNDVTRQAAAAFLFRYAGKPDGPFPDPGFADVPATHPFHEEIAWAAANNITGGYNDHTFRPGNDVTRQAIAAFLFRLSAAMI